MTTSEQAMDVARRVIADKGHEIRVSWAHVVALGNDTYQPCPGHGPDESNAAPCRHITYLGTEDQSSASPPPAPEAEEEEAEPLS